MTEFDCMERGLAPSPFADAVAAMYVSGVSAESTAAFFRIAAWEVALLTRWVCTTNLRRGTASVP